MSDTANVNVKFPLNTDSTCKTSSMVSREEIKWIDDN